MKKIFSILALLILSTVIGCSREKVSRKEIMSASAENKLVVYQVFTRLFGNTNTTNKPWGTIEENGVGKFNDFTD